jgi:uncharacterized protein YggT (Ycf19 family)
MLREGRVRVLEPSPKEEPMTHRDEPPPDETRVHEREVIRERPVEQPASQVNVSRGGATYAPQTPSPLYYARRVVVLLFAILQVLIVLRIILLALGASAANAIVDFIYTVTEPFVAPFYGMFNFDQISPNGPVFDVAALVALIGYFLLELLILAILSLGDRRAA